MEGGRASFQAALTTAGYNAAGLWSTAHDHGTPILCSTCHASNALPGTGIAGIPQLTHSVHSAHATVVDPKTGLTLGNSNNRSACYRCHPGSETRCLRGSMGKSVAADGTLAMQCQSCHGSMAQVGAITRTGWLDEPRCGNCHTGDAISNSGQIRFTSAVDSSGARRAAALPLFDTNDGAPAAGLSLYRFSFGHGGVACEACHGSTHAEYASLHVNDNVQSTQLQGHVGVIAECTACHDRMPNTISGGPHGLHPLGVAWVDAHSDAVENGGSGKCRACHGNDYKGTVLSRTVGTRSFSTTFGKKNFFAGAQVSCFACHNGPTSESATTNHPPKASDLTLATSPNTSQSVDLKATDADGNALTFRIVSQPQHGTVGLAGKRATYYPESKYTGPDNFTFAAWDGKIDSNLATATVSVQTSTCVVDCSATVGTSAAEGASLSFNATATATGCSSSPTYSWLFGDGGSASTASATHAYPFSGTYAWTLTVSAGGNSCNRNGSIVVDALAPSITKVTALKNPFRLRLDGSNIHSTVEMRIAGTPFTNFNWRSSNSIILKAGKPLSSLFPANTWVPVTLTNPDDGRSITIEVNRTLEKFR
ncbi:MAG: PKD domain-containing protein [Acidobacteriota bacterium]